MYDAVREVLGPKWTLEILALLVDTGTLNYSDIEAEIPTSSDVVVARLELLREHGLIERDERSQRDVRYSITEDGHTVVQHVLELDELLAE